MSSTQRLGVIVFPAALAVAACAPGESASSASAAEPGVAAAPARVQDSTLGTVDLGEDVALQLIVAPTGNAVRYRVREQLAGFDFPNDAVGSTTQISGGIALDSAGKPIAEASKFVVNVGTLKSDRERRDRYIAGRTLQVEQYPTVELVPTALNGVTLPLPSSGRRAFTMTGNLTVKGVTRPSTWQVNATFSDETVTGTATTAFTFADFGMEQPRVRSVLSVADTIKLEYDFTLVPR